MEAIGGIIVVFVGWMIVRSLLGAGAKTVGAAARAATGKGSFGENMEVAFKGISEFEVRLADGRMGKNADGPEFKAVEVKGLFPIHAAANLGIVISVFDTTDEQTKPVISKIDAFQETETVVFQHSTLIGEVTPDQGFLRWQRIGGVIPEILSPPKKGDRELAVVIRLVDADDPPVIQAGFCSSDDDGLLAVKTAKFRFTFIENGYEEEAENRDKARALSIKIGMAVAMADGSLDPAEGELLRARAESVE